MTCSTRRARLAPLVGAGGGRDEHPLADPLPELVEAQRPVVHRRRQPEAVLDQGHLAAVVALVLALELGHGHVRLVDEQHEVVGEVVDQGERRGAGVAAVDRPGVVLDPVAVADLAQHLQVVVGPHAQPLGLQQLALALQDGQPLGQLDLDGGDGPAHPVRPGHVVGGREDVQLVPLADDLAGDRVHDQDPLDLVAEELQAHGPLLVRREDLEGVAPDPELAPDEAEVVAVVLDVDQLAQHPVAVVALAALEPQHLVAVLLGRAEAVDADTEATTITSRLVSRDRVAEWRSRSISSFIEESFSM